MIVDHPNDYVWALSVLEGKRAVEEAIVARLLGEDYLPQFRPLFDRMPEGQFHVISAKKADKLLRERLFERVHALSLKGLELLVRESPQKFAVRL